MFVINNIIYNSFNYNKNILAKKVFTIKNDEQYACAESELFKCENVIIIDKKEYIQFDLYYDKTKDITLSKKIEEISKILIDNEKMKKYEEYPTFNTIAFYLNEDDMDFLIEIFDLSIFNIFDIDKYKIISLLAKPENVNIKVDDMVSNQFEDIEIFFKRKTLNKTEKDFIINNYQQQCINKYKKEKDNEKEDKDTKNFKDFMSKDNSVKFKITEEESKIFSPNTLKIIDGAKDPSAEINKLIGLNNVKTEILKLNAELDYRIKRESRNIHALQLENLHMCFYGNPGTGKTTVARIMTGLLYNMGYIKKNKCIEINANEMKGVAAGQTAVKTKIILRNAKNKVLFIDEAYALCDGSDGFGQEAVDTIVKEMEDNKHNLVIIFAGYKKEMQKFIDMNEGLKSRINRYINFENYNTIELSKIFVNMIHKKGLKITTDAMIKSMKIFKQISLQKNFSNGRFIRNYFEEIEEEHAFNTKDTTDPIRLDTIELEDINDNLIKQFIEQNKK